MRHLISIILLQGAPAKVDHNVISREANSLKERRQNDTQCKDYEDYEKHERCCGAGSDGDSEAYDADNQAQNSSDYSTAVLVATDLDVGNVTAS
jgi:hypothetical protein